MVYGQLRVCGPLHKYDVPSEEPCYTDISIFDADAGRVTQAAVPLLLPHEMFSFLMQDVRLARACVGADPSSFWARMAALPHMEGHPIASNPSKWATCLPLGFHGDAAKFSATDSALALSWNGLLAESRSSLSTRHLIAVVPTAFLIDVSKWELCKVITWSLAAIMDGRHPVCDHKGQPWTHAARRERAGQPLAEQWSGATVDFRGDWGHQQTFWRLPSPTGKKMCWLCEATKTGQTSWLFCGPNAQWRQRPRDTEWYLGRRRNLGINPLALLPGWRVQFIRMDEMHAVKAGIARWAFAGALLDMAWNGAFGPPPLDDQLQKAWVQFRAWRRRHRIQANPRKFTPDRLGVGRGEFAESASKAFNTRVLVSWLSECFQSWALATVSDRARVTAMVLHSLNDMFHLMERCTGLFFPAEVAERFCNAGDRAMLGYMWLAKDSTLRGLLVWPAHPKVHALACLCARKGETRNTQRAWATKIF